MSPKFAGSSPKKFTLTKAPIGGNKIEPMMAENNPAFKPAARGDLKFNRLTSSPASKPEKKPLNAPQKNADPNIRVMIFGPSTSPTGYTK